MKRKYYVPMFLSIILLSSCGMSFGEAADEEAELSRTSKIYQSVKKIAGSINPAGEAIVGLLGTLVLVAGGMKLKKKLDKKKGKK